MKKNVTEVSKKVFVLHCSKMKVIILLQILIVSIEICETEGETHTSIILNDSQTKMTVQRVQNSSRSSTTELFDNLKEIESDGNDLDFDYDDDDKETLKVGMKNPDTKEQELQEVLLRAMKKPAIRKQIGEVIPILRVMSPAQRLTLAALVSSQITSQNTLSEENLTEMAAIFAHKNINNSNERHNITEHLLLPISMDIAKIFKGLGKEMGRNLRQNFYKPVDSVSAHSNVRRIIRKPDFKQQTSINERIDVDGQILMGKSDMENTDAVYSLEEPITEEGNCWREKQKKLQTITDMVNISEVYYDQSEEQFSSDKPLAQALKQPGNDECDYFTQSLCLEVSNYPTEAIILSLKKNQDIAKTFLTDFEVPLAKETGNNSKNQGNGRRLERRQSGQNEAQDFAPEGGYMCPSSVKYARPKRARATSGQWKYIVNAGDYTQTLRLEICQKPKSPCSYVTNHLNSQCTQIYNYHRLLTWDEAKGLHMDIFKVPSCCSCHIQGYSNYFPPNKDYTFAEKRKEASEVADLVSEPQNRPPYGYLGNKREVSKHFPDGSSFQMTTKNQSMHQINAKDFYRDPVDHLVPPGPPLPLENEGTFNSYTESTFGQKKIYPELNRRYPVQVEYRRTINRVTDGTDTQKELPLSLKTHLNMPTFLSPEKPNVKLPKPHHPETFPATSQKTNPVFDSSNQIHFLKPLSSTPPFFPSLGEVKEKPSGSSVLMSSNLQKDLIFQSNIKTYPKQPSQFFKSEFIDTKGSPSRISSSYVASSKVEGMESRLSTTSVPPQKSQISISSKQKKINYSYHPIIDFFLSDSKKRQSTYSSPQYLTATSQDWTPVLGH